MPTYCYRLPSGRIVERQARMGHAPKRIRVAGETGVRDWGAESCPNPVGTGKTWCEANCNLGVHPKQIPEMQRLLERRGVRATQFDRRTGDCYVQDRAHGNEIAKARGMRFQDAGYGDWAGDGKGGGSRRE